MFVLQTSKDNAWAMRAVGCKGCNNFPSIPTRIQAVMNLIFKNDTFIALTMHDDFTSSGYIAHSYRKKHAERGSTPGMVSLLRWLPRAFHLQTIYGRTSFMEKTE
jgi:hypothetical protein